MEAAGLRRKDTTKGPPLRVLSLDGGGVRGYSMLILLQELMYRTYVEAEGKPPRKEEIPKPCDYFDLIAGTGTGGLIAIMLGRLRLDLETSKQVYVRMTRKVFESDKTIAGLPYTTTLFKASKLEEAIKECVREHTIFEDEGNDGTATGGTSFATSPTIPTSRASISMSTSDLKRQSTTSSNSGADPVSPRGVYASYRWGNPNASLYDARENRTKTAVTAVYKGTPKRDRKAGGGSVLLRSYDSRKEPPPEFNCTIWQAGRATAATGLAFKPIQIGQSVFIDEGAGNYNPAPQILDEAVINEWPGRDLGVIVSIGTGKRPSDSPSGKHEWWEGIVGGEFAEAKRRLLANIAGCEETHQYMKNEHLVKRGVNPENYYRLNVDVGVGDFSMNEWSRLADISTSTRKYVAKAEVQRILQDAGAKMGRIERSKRRHAREAAQQAEPDLQQQQTGFLEVPPPADPMIIELPGDEGPAFQSSLRPVDYRPTSQRYSNPQRPYLMSSSTQDKFTVMAPDEYPATAHPQSVHPQSPHPQSAVESLPQRRSHEIQYQSNSNRQTPQSSFNNSPRRSHEDQSRPPNTAPPLPPKTPIPHFSPRMSNTSVVASPTLPYPDTDGPPPLVNMARKPEYVAR